MRKEILKTVLNKRQRNLCSNLLKQSKKRHFNSLNVNDATENKKFWKTIKVLENYKSFLYRKK